MWSLGCGASGVGARVWVLGCGDGAGWIGIGWVWVAGWNGESSSQGVPIPDSDCRLGRDR